MRRSGLRDVKTLGNGQLGRVIAAVLVIAAVVAAGFVFLKFVKAPKTPAEKSSTDGSLAGEVGDSAMPDDLAIPHIYEEADSPAGCTVYLFHQVGGQKEDWSPYIPPILDAGCNVLAIDFTGHGERVTLNEMMDADWMKLPDDVFEAVQYGVALHPNDEHWLMGASIGANAALMAAPDLSLAGVVLLSPGLEYRGLSIEQAARAYSGPLVLVTSPTDTYSFESVLEIQDVSTANIRTIEAAAGHGLEMLEGEPDILSGILSLIVPTS